MFNVESLERAELGESLLTWIQTFNVEAPCQTVEDLTSGVVMAQVLQKIDPVYFDENWLNRIKTEVGDNWRLKGHTDRMLPETKMEHTAAVYVLTWPGNLSAWFLLSGQLYEVWNALECFVY